MSLGKRFVAAAIKSGSVTEFLGHGNIAHVFRPTELDVFQFVKGFVQHYGALPSEETILAHTGEALMEAKEPAGYYLDLMKERHVELEVKRAMKEANDNLTTENKDPEAALKRLTTMVMQLAVQRSQQQIMDFREAYDLIISDYTAKFNGEEETGILYGWPTLDEATGGVRKGDLVSEVGRPATGKTWKLLAGAMHGWNIAGKQYLANLVAAGADVQPKQIGGGSRLFVSMEMPPLEISQRLAAMQTHVPVGKLDKVDLDSAQIKRLKKGLTEIKGFNAPFWVVDGNLTATVEDIYMLARQLKPDGIWIDGGYLVKHPTERDRFRRVAENADLMKQELASLAPTTVSWQFAKTASKKKKGEAVTGDDVGYSDAIYQVSSLLTGIFQPETVETIHQRVHEILKGRKGQVGRYTTRWDFQNMDFSEIMEMDVGDLQFV